MKHKLLLILFAVVILAGWRPQTAFGAQLTQSTALKQQIQILYERIAQLRQQIATIILQREISAGSYLVVDAFDNSIILQKDSSKTYPIASLTKLMNAVVATENADLNEQITLQEKMLKPLGHSPSLFLGLKVSLKNLLKASLIQSTNDAAESLSYSIGHEKFLEAMNQKAKALGMNDTHFDDVHGLSVLNQSSAKDLVKLVSYIYKTHPEILSISKDNDFFLPDSTGKLLKFKNVNNFYSLSEFIGGKTGYLPEAKQSLASIFNLNEKPVIIVLLYSKNRQTDALKIVNWIKDNKNTSP